MRIAFIIGLALTLASCKVITVPGPTQKRFEECNALGLVYHRNVPAWPYMRHSDNIKVVDYVNEVCARNPGSFGLVSPIELDSKDSPPPR
jgi:hypothetical protein